MLHWRTLDSFPDTCYVGALTEDPGLVQDPLTIEAIGPAYSRFQVDFTEERFYGRLAWEAPVVFSGIAAGTQVLWIGLFDQPTNGNLLVAEALRTPAHFIKGGSLTLSRLELIVPGGY